MFRRVFQSLLLALSLVLGSVVSAETVQADSSMLTRPKVALVLSGGGARGFSHVGVIRELERLGVKIDIVAGTSMGAMVGGGYASGYSVEQMQDIILGVDWKEMFALRPDRDAIN